MQEPRILKLLRKHKLEQHSDLVRDAVVPGVRMQTPNPPHKPCQVGASKLGGEPDLHWSEPWPSRGDYPLAFLGQLRLSEVAKHAPKGILPGAGWIRFWYDELGEAKRMAASVIRSDKFEPSLVYLTLDPDESRTLDRRPWPSFSKDFPRDGEDMWAPYRESPIQFMLFETLRADALRQLITAEEAVDPDGGWDRCMALLASVQKQPYFRDDHQLLGDVYELQSDSRFSAACLAAGESEFAKRSSQKEAAFKREAARYCLLARLASDDKGPGFQWGDCGSLQWWIRDDHLAAGDLERAVGLYEQGA
ncbi:MAG: DUF1963 domain-containing protein [Phycisphaerales bacterium JB039]